MNQAIQRVAIVTGASRGIGKAIAIKLASEGYGVIVNYANHQTAAEQVVSDIRKAGGAAIAVKADISRLQEFTQVFEAAEHAFGKVDVLVNNAGISKLGPIAESDDATFDLLFNTNVRGTVNGLRLAATRLNTGGSIVNFSSTAVATATPGMGLYAGTKAAVEAISRVFAKELRGKNITVNTVAPGLIQSEMFFEGKSPEQIAQAGKLSPLERLGKVKEIADVVAYLAGPSASWVNGQLLKVNGGVI